MEITLSSDFISSLFPERTRLRRPRKDKEISNVSNFRNEMRSGIKWNNNSMELQKMDFHIDREERKWRLMKSFAELQKNEKRRLSAVREQGFNIQDWLKKSIQLIANKEKEFRKEKIRLPSNLNNSVSHPHFLKNSRVDSKLKTKHPGKKRNDLHFPHAGQERSLGNLKEQPEYIIKGTNLPELQELIQSMNAPQLVRAKGRRLIQLLIFVEMRRRNEKPVEALDLLLMVGDQLVIPQQPSLMGLCLRYINNLYKEIRAPKRVKNHNRPKRITRQRSINFQTPTARALFLSKIKELDSGKKYLYQSTIDAQNHIYHRLGRSDSLLLPTPAQLYDPSVTRYQIAVLLMNPNSCQFPYAYPETFKHHLSNDEFKFIISRVNYLLYPETRCFDLHSALSIFFIPLQLILFALLFVSLGLALTSSLIIRCIILTFGLLTVTGLTGRIVLDETAQKSLGNTYNQLVTLLNKQEEKLSQKRLKFNIDHDMQALFISVPLKNRFRIKSSQSNLASSKQLTEKSDYSSYQNESQSNKSHQLMKKLQLVQLGQAGNDPIQEDIQSEAKSVSESKSSHFDFPDFSDGQDCSPNAQNSMQNEFPKKQEL